MSERFGARLADARRHLDVAIEAEALDHGVQRLERRLVRRKRVQRASLALGVATLGVLALLWGGALRPRAAPLAALRTRDGSLATPRTPSTELSLERDTGEAVELRLARGTGHFEVTRNPKRRYRVHAGDVDVEVLGTAFDVERVAGGRTRVRVDHGLVRVAWAGGASTLSAGQMGLFPPPARPPAEPLRSEPVTATSAAAPAASAPAEAASAAPPRVVADPPRAAEPARERWRSLARAGKHAEAYGSLGRRAVEDLAGLLLAADAARLSGHPREAARYLDRLTQRYPKSPEARLAAFTLGRLALYELEQPARAAAGFARAYALDPKGPLAEDALAREAEAYHRAGDADRARTTAQRYLERFPQGARRKELAAYLEAR